MGRGCGHCTILSALDAIDGPQKIAPVDDASLVRTHADKKTVDDQSVQLLKE